MQPDHVRERSARRREVRGGSRAKVPQTQPRRPAALRERLEVLLEPRELAPVARRLRKHDSLTQDRLALRPLHGRITAAGALLTAEQAVEPRAVRGLVVRTAPGSGSGDGLRLRGTETGGSGAGSGTGGPGSGVGAGGSGTGSGTGGPGSVSEQAAPARAPAQEAQALGSEQAAPVRTRRRRRPSGPAPRDAPSAGRSRRGLPCACHRGGFHRARQAFPQTAGESFPLPR